MNYEYVLSLYSRLGYNQNSTPAEINQIYRQLAKQYHPDICKDLTKSQCFPLLAEVKEKLIFLHIYRKTLQVNNIKTETVYVERTKEQNASLNLNVDSLIRNGIMIMIITAFISVLLLTFFIGIIFSRL